MFKSIGIKARFVVIAWVILLLGVACNSGDEILGANDKTSDKSASEEVVTKENNKDIVFPSIKMTTVNDDLKARLDDYSIEQFTGSFYIENTDEESLDMSFRIELGPDLIITEADVVTPPLIVFGNEDEEVVFHLESGERKKIKLTSVDYQVYPSVRCVKQALVGTLDALVVIINGKVYYLNEVDGLVLNDMELDSYKAIKERAMNETIKYQLEDQVKELEDQVLSLKSIIDDYKNMEDNDYIVDYNGQKWPRAIGIKTYNGSLPVHVYPNEISPTVELFYEGQTVDVLEYVWSYDWDDEVADKGTWFIIMNSAGNIGFVKEEGISDYEGETKKEEMIFYDVTEAIKGCTLGDRIEKLIGSLDQDYLPFHENGKFYGFLDQDAVKAMDDERFDPFSAGGEMTVFVDELKHITSMRISSSLYQLDSGYGVGSHAMDVKAYYDELYPLYIREQDPSYQPNENPPFTLDYQIGEHAVLSFYIDTEVLSDESLISGVTFNKAPIYY